MKCPNDNTTLVMSDRQGVEIDYCPGCRGVWLDRGELDKIIDRSNVKMDDGDMRSYPVQPQQYENKSKHHDGKHKKRKRENFLEDLFNF